MSKQKKSNCASGNLQSDFLMDSPSPEYIPDKHNYDFLSIYEDFSISKHASLLKRLIKAIENTKIYDHIIFDYELADYLSVFLCKATKVFKHRSVLFRDSLFPRFASRNVDKSLVFDIALLIAGNMNIIHNEQVIVPNYDLKYPAWVPMSVTDIKDDPKQTGNKKVVFFADGGIFAGSTISKYMSPKFIRFVLKEIGMPRRTKCSVRDIFGTKMSILMIREGSGVGMCEFNTSSSQESYNKSLFKVRYGDRPCYMGHYESCHECVNGTDVCEYAVYKKSEQS